MSAVTEERIRSCLIREGVCGNAPAAELASVIAAEINEGDAGKVTEDQLARAIAELNASIAQLAREFAERDAARAELFAQHISEMHELERQRDEREREQNCIREVEERGTRRDTELQASERRFQRASYAAFCLATALLGLAISVLVLVA